MPLQRFGGRARLSAVKRRSMCQERAPADGIVWRQVRPRFFRCRILDLIRRKSHYHSWRMMAWGSSVPSSPALFVERLAPRCETLDSVKGALPAGTTLLGICGARVASYMIACKCTRDQALARLPIATR